MVGVQAAPASSDDLQPAAPAKGALDQPGAQSPTTVLPIGAASVTQSKTVELMLQLQDPNAVPHREAAGKPGAEVPRLPTGKSVPADAATSTPLDDLKAAVIVGNQFLKGSDSQEQAPRPTRAVERLDGAAPEAKASTEQRPSILMNPVVRFIRENRGLTATACLLLLAGIWATASFSMRRSR